MLRTKSLSVFLVLLGIGINANAASSTINRGGLGFLFPDNNSFSNPGQFADSRGFAVEGVYGRTTATTPTQSLTPSMVFGNGSFGMGAYGSRSGTELLTTAGVTDTIGAGLGISLFKGRATFGAKYDKVLGSANNGTVSGTFTLNPAGAKGMAIGVGYTRDITAGTNAVSAGLGYSFMGNNNIEVDISFPSISALGTFNLGAYFTMMKSMIYLSGGYLMQNSGTMIHGATGRLGFLLGQQVDFSATGTYFFVTGSTISYGGSFRVAF